MQRLLSVTGTLTESSGAGPETAPAPAATPGVLADWRRALVLFLVWRGLLFGVEAVGITLTRPNPVSQVDPADPWRAFPDNATLDGWARWDSGWYRSIVERGYSVRRGRQSNVAFYPGFPYATSAVAGVTGNHWVAGLVVSNLSVLGSLFFLIRLARPIVGDDGAVRAASYLLAFPASFFLSAYYSEGLFLLATAASFSSYLRGGYLACGLWGALATATRPTGVALLAAFAAGTAWKLARKSERFRPSMLAMALIPGGIALFMALLFIKVGDPLAFARAHGAWGRSSAWPHEAIASALRATDWTFPRQAMNTITLLDAASALAFLALPLFLVGRCDPALPIYSILLILVPLSTGSVKSMLRLECVAFPAFLVLARWGARREVDRAIVFGSALLLGVLTLQFANWNWVG